MKNIFEPSTTSQLLNRMDQLSATSQPLWGKMSVSQMMAHCNVTYEMVYTDKHAKPKGFLKFFLKNFVKKSVVGNKPYPKNGRTAPAFLITTDKDFSIEKLRLTDHLKKTEELGTSYFEGRESHGFGKLKSAEWSTLFYKHLDHHLNQFGV
ncbi:MAG: DUF1569 domain-containing protein [Nonlabens sp.]